MKNTLIALTIAGTLLSTTATAMTEASTQTALTTQEISAMQRYEATEVVNGNVEEVETDYDRGVVEMDFSYTAPTSKPFTMDAIVKIGTQLDANVCSNEFVQKLLQYTNVDSVELSYEYNTIQGYNTDMEFEYTCTGS